MSYKCFERSLCSLLRFCPFMHLPFAYVLIFFLKLANCLNAKPRPPSVGRSDSIDESTCVQSILTETPRAKSFKDIDDRWPFSVRHLIGQENVQAYFWMATCAMTQLSCPTTCLFRSRQVIPTDPDPNMIYQAEEHFLPWPWPCITTAEELAFSINYCVPVEVFGGRYTMSRQMLAMRLPFAVLVCPSGRFSFPRTLCNYCQAGLLLNLFDQYHD